MLHGVFKSYILTVRCQRQSDNLFFRNNHIYNISVIKVCYNNLFNWFCLKLAIPSIYTNLLQVFTKDRSAVFYFRIRRTFWSNRRFLRTNYHNQSRCRLLKTIPTRGQSFSLLSFPVVVSFLLLPSPIRVSRSCTCYSFDYCGCGLCFFSFIFLAFNLIYFFLNQIRVPSSTYLFSPVILKSTT